MAGFGEIPVTTYQLVLVGDHGAGKSSIFTRFKEDPFRTTFEDYSFDQTIKEFTKNNRKIQVCCYHKNFGTNLGQKWLKTFLLFEKLDH